MSGFTGTGKSTLGRRLADYYQIRYISGGTALKKLLAGEGATKDVGWWERGAGAEAMQVRKSDPSFDRRVDQELMRLAQEKRDLIIDSWTLPYLLKSPDRLAIFLKADLEERADRIMRRDRISYEKALKEIKRKDLESKEIYNQIYGFKMGEDLSPFQLVIDNTRFSPKETFGVVFKYIDAWFERDQGL